ncbi:hypothetical protein AB1399_09525 [Hydrogenibacillus schlegelii]|uniref:Alkyl hydroperoxide reductase subunit C-like protein n=1 Tax=Hydrogenibacillus schlegelii TaxID=1484 RepID=A0A179IPN0_HYDSH|nr:hypothetical protein [Hydrogenibacillus schlegelii]OAR04305.1 hypothetical protein SA87_01155 [Hydrogenibacillus schlegelii]PTQ50774.1 MAG: Alkyl hydroperoxide reductase subunit C-like protein [Hydrogenibacillus schlegelii]
MKTPGRKKRGVEHLGLSIDSPYAQIAWVRNLEEKLGVRIEFPIIEDLSMTVAPERHVGGAGGVHPRRSANPPGDLR